VNPDETVRWDAALDSALARALAPPELPAQFRNQLTAAIAREAALEIAMWGARPRLEREQRERLAELEAGYMRLRRRTLGTLIGGAFAAGAAVAVALPWLKSAFGPNAMLVLAALGAVAGLAIGTASWMGRLGVPRLLQRF
jgi:hypothetical protein